MGKRGFNIENMPREVRWRIFIVSMTVIGGLIVIAWGYSFRYSIVDERTPEENAQWEQIRRDFDDLLESTRTAVQPLENTTQTPTTNDSLIPQEWRTYTSRAFNFRLQHPAEFNVTVFRLSTTSATIAIGESLTESRLQFQVYNAKSATTTTGTYRWIIDDTIIAATDFKKNATTSLILSTFTIQP